MYFNFLSKVQKDCQYSISKSNRDDKYYIDIRAARFRGTNTTKETIVVELNESKKIELEIELRIQDGVSITKISYKGDVFRF